MANNQNTNKKTGWNVKEASVLPDPITSAKDGPRTELNPDKFDRLIKNHGVRVKVYRTSYCPQVKSLDGGEHEIDCELCNGSGFVDRHCIETYAYIQNQSLEKLASIEGFIDNNSVAATFLSGIELQYYTLVELLDYTDIFYQRVKRSASTKDILKYKALRVNFIMAYNGTEYYQGSDFTLDVNGSILWKPGKGPSTNTIYTIHYEAAVQFRATRALHVNRFVQTKASNGIEHRKAPEQWQLAKEFLVRRKDINGDIMDTPPVYNE